MRVTIREFGRRPWDNRRIFAFLSTVSTYLSETQSPTTDLPTPTGNQQSIYRFAGRKIFLLHYSRALKLLSQTSFRLPITGSLFLTPGTIENITYILYSFYHNGLIFFLVDNGPSENFLNILFFGKFRIYLYWKGRLDLVILKIGFGYLGYRWEKL